MRIKMQIQQEAKVAQNVYVSRVSIRAHFWIWYSLLADFTIAKTQKVRNIFRGVPYNSESII